MFTINESYLHTFVLQESPKRKRRKSGRGNVTEAIEELGLVAIGTVSGSILLYNVKKGDLHSELVCSLILYTCRKRI